MLMQRANSTRRDKESAPHPPRPNERAGSIELMGALIPFARNSEIFGENEPADYLYKLVSGSVRSYRVLIDGRRQIGAFYLPGDIFGLETGEAHTSSAEAITDCKILVIKRSSIMALAARQPEVAQEMWAATSRELKRVQAHSLHRISSLESISPERISLAR